MAAPRPTAAATLCSGVCLGRSKLDVELEASEVCAGQAATLLTIFLLPVTFIVHDFWAATKYASGSRPVRAQWVEAGCAEGGARPAAPVPTFGAEQVRSARPCGSLARTR